MAALGSFADVISQLGFVALLFLANNFVSVVENCKAIASMLLQQPTETFPSLFNVSQKLWEKHLIIRFAAVVCEVIYII
jgi:hypothetical protein